MWGEFMDSCERCCLNMFLENAVRNSVRKRFLKKEKKITLFEALTEENVLEMIWNWKAWKSEWNQWKSGRSRSSRSDLVTF